MWRSPFYILVNVDAQVFDVVLFFNSVFMKLKLICFFAKEIVIHWVFLKFCGKFVNWAVVEMFEFFISVFSRSVKYWKNEIKWCRQKMF